MITFINLSQKDPYIKFKDKYNEAISCNQDFVEAALIASFSSEMNEVDARFVNLKFIDNGDFVFFTNLESPKSMQFKSHDQVSVVIFWSKLNLQIRIKAKIRQTPEDFNNNYFKDRSKDKNALAISSNQSKEISSYEKVKANYEETLRNKDLTICPEYWGGFSFTPYYFEYWEGRKQRLNRREAYKLEDSKWIKFFLQP
jgi:pyridoxamine 5'-phosphate oxidase